MRKFFIYISLITFIATFTAGESFAKMMANDAVEDVDFSNEKENELEEETNEAVVSEEHVQLNSSKVTSSMKLFSLDKIGDVTSKVTFTINDLYLLHCVIIR